jgi:hypothetical protein
MAEDYVTVDAQRSRFFGPDGTYEQRGNGVTVNILDSDFFLQQIIDSHVIDHLLSLQPPLGLELEARHAISGYVAGYNRYLADVVGSGGVPTPPVAANRGCARSPKPMHIAASTSWSSSRAAMSASPESPRHSRRRRPWPCRPRRCQRSTSLRPLAPSRSGSQAVSRAATPVQAVLGPGCGRDPNSLVACL